MTDEARKRYYREYMRRWRALHPERHKAVRAKWLAAGGRAQRNAWARANREKTRRYKEAYYAKHRDEINARRRARRFERLASMSPEELTAHRAKLAYKRKVGVKLKHLPKEQQPLVQEWAIEKGKILRLYGHEEAEAYTFDVFLKAIA